MSLLLQRITFLTSSFFMVFGGEDIRKVHSLLGPFDAGNAYLSYWDLTGSSERSTNFIRLTSDEPGKKGALWNNHESELHEWELQLQFRIHGKGVNLNGDGMAIWYAREPLRLGPVFGSKNYFSGVAIFIDTYKSFATSEASDEYIYPYVSVMVNNGSLHYNSAQDGRYTNVGGCHVKVRNLENNVKLAVSYVNSVLMVFLDMEGIGDWKQCFKSHGIHLPTGYYFGVSASTGELSDNHDVYAIKVLDMEDPDVDREDRSGIMPEAEYFELPKEWKETIEERRIFESEETISTSTALGITLFAAGFNALLIAAVILCRRYFEQQKRMPKIENTVRVILYPDTENVF